MKNVATVLMLSGVLPLSAFALEPYRLTKDASSFL